jgi:hypothetical protein
VNRLRRKFPFAQIDEAGSRQEAKTLIKAALNPYQPYDIAILDLKLPEVTGELETRDTSLASLIIDTFGRLTTRLIQWTAFPEDTSIDKFREQSTIPQSGIVYEVLSKRDIGWPRKMEEFINRFVAEKTVGSWLDDDYFKQMRNRSLAVISRRPAAVRAPVDIPAFVLALIDMWRLLEPHRRQEAIATFEGTEWELAEVAGGVKLTNPKTVEAVEDARENARIFAEVIGSHNQQE